MSKKTSNHHTFQNVIHTDTTVRGDMETKSSFRVDGVLLGNLHSQDTVIVGKQGKVKGDIVAKDIIVEGHVEGNVTALKHILLESGGSIAGTVVYKTLEVKEGGKLLGSAYLKENDASDIKPSEEKSKAKQQKSDWEANIQIIR